MPTRREMLGSLGAAGYTMLSAPNAQLSDSQNYAGHGILVGPISARPSPAELDQMWTTYDFLYYSTEGERWVIDDGDAQWSKLGMVVKSYSDANLPTSPLDGTIVFDTDRRTIATWDGNNWEWPTFTDNDDVSTSTKTVANTTTETEILRKGLDDRALQQARIFILRAFGKYSTASSNDNFTYRVKIGDAGFDAVIGGTTVASIDTVQENVTDGPFHAKTTFTVFSEGASGAIQSHTEASFNNNKADKHGGSITIDTTTAEEFVATVQWNNAKADNSVTRAQSYIQQQG